MPANTRNRTARGRTGHAGRSGRPPRRGGSHAARALRPGSRGGWGRRRRWLVLALVALVGAGALATQAVDLGKPIREVTLPLRNEDTIRQQARDKELDAALIAAVIYAESRFRDVESHAGAKGFMQILPDTALFIANRSGGTAFEIADLSNPDINIRYGSWYLRYLMDRYHGNEVAALAAYNAGHENVDRWGGDDLRLDDIRFPETSAYVAEVLGKREDYAQHRRSELGL